MTPQDIQAAVKAALKEHREEFWVDAERHYQDHQAIFNCRSKDNEADHAFIRAIRERKDEAIKIGWKMFIVGGVGFLAIAIWEHVISTIIRGGK